MNKYHCVIVALRLFSSIASLHRSRNQEVKVGLAPLISNPSDLLVEFILLILENLTSTGLQVLVLLRGARELATGELVKVLLNLKLSLPPSLDSLCGWTIFAGVIAPDYHEKLGLLLHNGDRREHVSNEGDSLGCL